LNEKSAILEVRNLWTWFDTEDGKVHAVNGISFDLHEGETLGIVGESGCGKSVTMLSIMRLLAQPPAHIQADKIRLFDLDLIAMSEDEMREIRGGKKKSAETSPSSSDTEGALSSLTHLLGNLKKKSPSLVLVADKTPLTAGLPADHFVSRGGAISFAAGVFHAESPEPTTPVLGVTDSAALLHYGMQATTNAVYNTASVKCILLVHPEHAQAVHAFLDAMEHVAVVPIKPNARNALKKIEEPPSQPVTFYTLSTEEAA